MWDSCQLLLEQVSKKAFGGGCVAVRVPKDFDIMGFFCRMRPAEILHEGFPGFLFRVRIVKIAVCWCLDGVPPFWKLQFLSSLDGPAFTIQGPFVNNEP